MPIERFDPVKKDFNLPKGGPARRVETGTPRMLVALRMIGLILIVIALLLLGADIVTSLDKGGEISVRSVQDIWGLFGHGSIDAFKAWTDFNLRPIAHGVETVLVLPSWSVPGVLGVVLNFLFGRHATAR